MYKDSCKNYTTRAATSVLAFLIDTVVFPDTYEYTGFLWEEKIKRLRK